LPGEARDGISEWTTDTALAHVLALRDADDTRYEQRFLAQEKSVAAALHAAEKATDKADTAAEKRFDGVNEFRATLKDQQGTYITRTEVYAIASAVAAIAAIMSIIGHYVK
jgi:hypothetical protein